MNEPQSEPLSRRQLLKQASRGTLAIGAASALVATPLVAQEDKSPAVASKFTDFERSCVRFRIDTTK